MFDLNAIKHSDAPGTKKIQPNGLTGEEACQLSRYSGISDATQCFGIFEYEPSIDEQGITAKVIAQMVWYFLDGLTFPCSYMDYQMAANGELPLRYMNAIKRLQ